MYILLDTFNDCTISRHRTLGGAVSAQIAHAKMIRRTNGPASYIPTSIRRDNGTQLDSDEASEAEQIRAALMGC